MDEILKVLPQGYQAPIWLVTLALAMHLLGFKQMASALYRDWLKQYLQASTERMKYRVDGLLLENVVYSRYMNVARHLVSQAWNVMVQVHTGNIAADAVVDTLRSQTSATIADARNQLSRYTSAGGLPLSMPLGNLTTERKTEFYGIIAAEMLQHAQSADYWRGYEPLRLVILRETDQLVLEAIDQLTAKKG